MEETEAVSHEHVASVYKLGQFGGKVPVLKAVNPVSQNRMADCREVNPYLMGSPRKDPCPEQGDLRLCESLKNEKLASGWLPFPRESRELLSAHRVASNGKIHCEVTCQACELCRVSPYRPRRRGFSDDTAER